MTSIGKKKIEAVNAYLIKNSKGEGGEGGGGGGGEKETKTKTGGRGWVGRQSEGLGGELYGY